jgi:long-chain acyl-CoA synthetase
MDRKPSALISLSGLMTFEGSSADAVIQAIIADLVAAELRSRRPAKFTELSASDVFNSADWRADFSLDSMDRMALATACAEFFNVYDSTREDTLLGSANCVRWSEIVLLARSETTRDVSFRSSGSTGKAKLFRHRAQWLEQEAEYWSVSVRLHSRKRIVAYVPLHHIYGYIWVALLASHSELPFVRLHSTTLAPPALLDGDLLITTPHLLEQWFARGVSLSADVIAVTSTGRFVQSNANEVATRVNFNSIWEIYGSSETAGLGIRKSGESSYQWLDYIEPVMSDSSETPRNINAVIRTTGGDRARLSLNDEVTSADESQRFVIGERTDDVIKIAGHRIDLNELRKLLLTMPNVRDANARAIQDGASAALKIFLVPSENANETSFISASQQWLREHWMHAGYVSKWKIGAALPRNAMGKLTDW